ncbi:MAG: peptidoglycan DD-metalloendopeptidase family protein [Parcubacteria group bacterium]
MQRLVLCTIIALSTFLDGAKAAEVLTFPFDHDETVDCGWGCYTTPFFHEGLDYRQPEGGMSIYAAISGQVELVNNVPGQTCSPSFGNYVKITSGNYQVIHAHMVQNSFVVTNGEYVVAGQYLGQLGNSGYTLTLVDGEWVCGQGGGYHLHLELRVKINNVWTAVNPDTYDGGMWITPREYGKPYFAKWITQSTVPDPVDPGEEVSLWVQYKNIGSATWRNTSGSDYVELASCGTQGDAGESFFNYPCGSAPGWLNCVVPTTMDESTVAADGIATFTFAGEVRSDATPGMHYAYFAPYHDADAIQGWGGMNYPINVSDPPPPLSPADNSMAMMAGDFDNDGTVNDLACIYDYEGSECRIHTWCSNGSSFVYSDAIGWWRYVSGYPSENVRHAVAGDFDDDGYKDDVAALYDYGLQANGKYRSCWHVWLGTGSSFVYQGVGPGWWIIDGYDANRVIDAVAGDFDEDGDDDIATIYDYDSDTCAIHVWLSTGSSFAYEGPQGWYYLASGYPSQNVKFMVSGDWDNDGDDDVSTFYDYGWTGSAYRTRIHTWLSDGTEFDYQGGGGWWTYDGFNMDMVTQVFAGDFNADSKTDVAALYDYGWIPAQQKYQSKIHVWFSTGSAFTYQSTWWNVYGYNAQQAWYGMSAYLNADSYADLVTAYDYSDGDTTRLHVWLSTGSTLNYQGGGGWWYSYGYPLPKYDSAVADELNTGTLPLSFSLSQNYPNPFNAATVIGYDLSTPGHVKIDVFNILGQRIETLIDENQEAGRHQLSWNASGRSSGVYFYRIVTPSATEAKKMVLLK